jgi:hypothetical protein
MPIVGNLSEFPLPEVLILIGLRTGRLRLLDVPEFGILDIDISNGEVQAMHIGANRFTDTQNMLDKLGAVVQAQRGMFEFSLTQVSLAIRPQSLTIHDLVMKLVCHVDEQTAQQQLAPAAEQRHRLVIPQPEIWMDPELNQFFQAARSLLAVGMRLDEISQHLHMETGLVYKNLTHLRSLGLIEPASGETALHAEEEAEQREQMARRNDAFLRVTRMTDHIRKLTSRLPAA